MKSSTKTHKQQFFVSLRLLMAATSLVFMGVVGVFYPQVSAQEGGGAIPAGQGICEHGSGLLDLVSDFAIETLEQCEERGDFEGFYTKGAVCDRGSDIDPNIFNGREYYSDSGDCGDDIVKVAFDASGGEGTDEDALGNAEQIPAGQGICEHGSGLADLVSEYSIETQEECQERGDFEGFYTEGAVCDRGSDIDLNIFNTRKYYSEDGDCGDDAVQDTFDTPGEPTSPGPDDISDCAPVCPNDTDPVDIQDREVIKDELATVSICSNGTGDAITQRVDFDPNDAFECDCDPADGQLNAENCGIVNAAEVGTNILATIAALAIVGGLSYGSFLYMTAGDNPGQISAARQRIVWALVALGLLLFFWGFLQWLIPGGFLEGDVAPPPDVTPRGEQ